MNSGCLIVYRWYLCPHPVFPTVVVCHWRSRVSPGWQLAEDQSGQRGTGRSITNYASSPCASVTSFVWAQLTRNHGWASGPLASNPRTPCGFPSPGRWQGLGQKAAVVTPNHKHRKSWKLTHQHARHSTATCLGWHTQRKSVASGHPAWCLCGGGAKGDPLAMFGWKPGVRFAPLTEVQKRKASGGPSRCSLTHHPTAG